jgi:hypothetical protein
VIRWTQDTKIGFLIGSLLVEVVVMEDTLATITMEGYPIWMEAIEKDKAITILEEDTILTILEEIICMAEAWTMTTCTMDRDMVEIWMMASCKTVGDMMALDKLVIYMVAICIETVTFIAFKDLTLGVCQIAMVAMAAIAVMGASLENKVFTTKIDTEQWIIQMEYIDHQFF